MFLKQCFSTRGPFASVWSDFWLFELGRECYWHLLSTDQGCSSTFCKAQHSPTTKNCLVKIGVVPHMRNSCSLGIFFKAKLSQIFCTFSITNSMPDISKREEKRTPKSSLQSVAPSLSKIFAKSSQNLRSEKQSKPV